jgi:hypothetical protein
MRERIFVRATPACAFVLLLLGESLFLGGCATWRIRSELPEADHPARHVRVTLNDGGTVELSHAYVHSDSLVGRAVDPAWRSSGGETSGVPLDAVASVHDWRLSPVRTGLAVVGGAAVGGGIILGAVALSIHNDPDY